MKKFIYLFILFIPFLISCKFKYTVRNDKEDIIKADSIISQFYTDLKEENEMYKYFSEYFFSNTSEEKLPEMLNKIDSAYGNIINYEKTDIETERNFNKLIIETTYIVTYENEKTIEKFILKCSDNKSILIDYYSIKRL